MQKQYVAIHDDYEGGFGFEEFDERERLRTFGRSPWTTYQRIDTADELWLQLEGQASEGSPDLAAGCVEAMEAAFALTEAIDKHGLSVADLTGICRVAIGGGHDLMRVALSMMGIAAQRARAEGEPEA